MPGENRRSARKVRGWYLPFLLIFLAMAYLAFSVSLPLFGPLAWSVLLSFTVYPAFSWMKRRLFPRSRGGNMPAALATGVIILVVVMPALFGGYVAAREGIKLYESFSGVLEGIGRSGGIDLTDLLPAYIADMIRPLTERYPIIEDLAQQIGERLGPMVVSASRAIVGSTLTIAWNLAIIIVVSFFLIRDGNLIIGYLTDIIPLPPGEREAFFRRAKEILQAVVYGVIVTAFVQGILGAAGWWYAGLQSPVFFGAMMMLLAMIPFVGTALLWGPAGIYLLYAGKLGDGIFLLLWGTFVVSMADNFIRPLFISGGAKLHLLTVFIGVVGGLAAWGFLGLFMGPLVISLFFFLLESYRTMWKAYLASPSRSSGTAGNDKK